MTTTAPQRFVKNPVEIEAIRFALPNPACPDWDAIGQRIEEWSDGVVRYHRPTLRHDTHLTIDTLEGVMTALVGDWIIRGVKGEFYPCKPDVFAETYSPSTVVGEGGEGVGALPATDAVGVAGGGEVPDLMAALRRSVEVAVAAAAEARNEAPTSDLPEN